MSAAASCLAPAKVNLGLRVVGRRTDGYHLLESVFVPLDLADRLRIRAEPAAETTVALRLTGPAPDVPTGADNLVVRAARGFAEAARLAARVEIELEKRIPAGAGLGGGSSDAAAVLRALSRRFANAIPQGALAALALRLGADVPFFLDPRPAWVTGIGEGIEPIARLPALDLLLVTPAPPLPTAAVFRAFDAALTPVSPSRRMPALRDGPGLLSLAALANDLEPAAARLHPGISRVRAELERLGARAVAMSGSGPTVYGWFGDAEGARSAARAGRFEATDRVLVVRTLEAPESAS